MAAFEAIISVDDRAYFTLIDGDRQVSLWTTDGTASDTRQLRTFSESFRLTEFEAVGPLVYFVADDGATGHELWVTDGTAEGTVNYDIFPGPSASLPTDLIEYQGALYFSAADALHGRELWSADSNLPLPGDFNRDGVVGFEDFLILQANFGQTNTPHGDITGDAAVLVDDFLLFARHFGRQGGPPVLRSPLI